MSLNNLSTASLEKLISLVKKREALQAELAAVEQQLSAALGETSAPAAASPAPKRGRRKGKKVKAAATAPAGTAAPAVKPVASVAKAAKPAKKGKRGALKESVLAALKAAGSEGIAVKDLSAKLGVKNQNLHVWFSTTGKTVKGLKKTKAGTWAYAG